MADKQQIFRKKSLEAINTPESLNEYLKVTSAGVWLLMAAIIVLLVGGIVWGCLGHIDSTTNAAVVADGKETVCLVPEEALKAVVEEQKLTIDGKEYSLTPDVLEPTAVTEKTNVYVLLAGGLEPGDIVYEIKLDTNLPEGVYTAEIITERITPISFLIN